MQEEAYSMSKILGTSNANSHHSKEERQQESAAFPGIVPWKDMFEDDILKLPDSSFMNQLRQAVPHEQFWQIANEILRTIGNKKEDFCKGTYYTLQDAKKWLHALLTKVMMDGSEYVIDKTIERAERELANLKQLKSQAKSIADPKQANRNHHQ